MPTTINVNEAGYDLDIGGATGSIVSGTLELSGFADVGSLKVAYNGTNNVGLTDVYSYLNESQFVQYNSSGNVENLLRTGGGSRIGATNDLGGQLRVKATTDTPAIIAQAYAGTSNAFEAWDASNNVVAEISKTGAATFDGGLTVGTALYINIATVRVGIGVSPQSILTIGGDQILLFESSGFVHNVSNIKTPSNGAGPLVIESANLRVGGDVAGGRLNVLGTADSLIPFSVQQGSGGTTQLVKMLDSSSNEKIAMYSTGVVVIGGGLTLVPAASATPATNGQLTFEATSNTSLTVKYKGSDGTVRSTVLTLS